MSRLDLGIGLTWFPAWDEHFDCLQDIIEVIEVEPQTLCWESDEPDQPFLLDEEAAVRLCALPQAKLVHGVSSPVGTAGLPDPAGARLLALAATKLEAQLASEHLSFNRTSRDGGMSFAGFLLPPRQSEAGAEQAGDGAQSLAAAVTVPFSVETGVNYLQPRTDEIRDGEFVAKVAAAADCGILLDLHNVWTNERNGRQPIGDFLDDLPLERIFEVHVAGGFEFGGYWLDAHTGLMPEPLVDVAEWVLPRLPHLRAIVLEVLPEHVARLDVMALRRQLQRLRTIAERRTARGLKRRHNRGCSTKQASTTAFAAGPSAKDWEDVLGDLAAGQIPATEIQNLADDPAIPILETLVKIARVGRITDGLRLTFRAILLTKGPEGVEILVDRYSKGTRPQLWGSAESTQFARWIESEDVAPFVRDVAALEAAAIAALRGRRTIEVTVSIDPHATLASLGEGKLPELTSSGTFRVKVTP